jgi:hypothetical protein
MAARAIYAATTIEFFTTSGDSNGVLAVCGFDHKPVVTGGKRRQWKVAQIVGRSRRLAPRLREVAPSDGT